MRNPFPDLLPANVWQTLHPSHQGLLRYFVFDHLGTDLANASRPFASLAIDVALRHGADGPETTVALRKLLESKDAAVRAMLPTLQDEPEQTTRDLQGGGTVSVESASKADVLDLPLSSNGVADTDGKQTVGEALADLLIKVLEEDEGFDGKRPWGNSGWWSIFEEAMGREDDWDRVQAELVEAIKARLT